LLQQTRAAVPLEDEVRTCLEADDGCLMVVRGGPGSGKTTAIEHLRALFGDRDRFVAADESDSLPEILPDRQAVVVITVDRDRKLPRREAGRAYDLAPWGV
jgi:energy-coupling factor transporter ATP-binding protein EcfA2